MYQRKVLWFEKLLEENVLSKVTNLDPDLAKNSDPPFLGGTEGTV